MSKQSEAKESQEPALKLLCASCYPDLPETSRKACKPYIGKGCCISAGSSVSRPCFTMGKQCEHFPCELVGEEGI